MKQRRKKQHTATSTPSARERAQFIKAAATGDLGTLSAFVVRFPQHVDSRDGCGGEALMTALENGRHDAVKLLTVVSAGLAALARVDEGAELDDIVTIWRDLMRMPLNRPEVSQQKLAFRRSTTLNGN